MNMLRYYVLLTKYGNLWSKDSCKLYAFDDKKTSEEFYAKNYKEDEDGIAYIYKARASMVKNIYGKDFENYIVN